MGKLLDTGPSPRGWHRVQNMLECAQKYSYRYNLDKEPTFSAAALLKGSLMHLALAHHYQRLKNKQLGLDPEEWLPAKEAVDLKCLQEPENIDYQDLINNCYDEYVNRWMIEDQHLKILEVEKLAYVVIDDLERDKKYLLTGRFDMVVEWEGKVWVVDHKTTSRLSSSHEKYYAVSGQLIGYEYMARQIYGERLGGVLLNFAQHTVPCKFERRKIPPRPNLSAQFAPTIIDAERRITDLQNSGRPYDQWPKAMNELSCYTRYGACPYIEDCKYGSLPF